MLASEERHGIEALPAPENVAGRGLSLAFRDHPMLDADLLTGVPVWPPGDVATS